MKPIDFSVYIEIAGHFVQLGIFALFVVGCFLLWRVTCRISLGFELIGRIVTIVMFTALLLMAFVPERVVLFRIIVYSCLTIWLYYTVWYFSRYPIPQEFLTADRVPKMPGHPLFLPKLALLRYLVQPSPALKQAWWHSRALRNAGIFAIGFILLAYGFSQSVNQYSLGLNMSSFVQQQSARETRKEVKKAVVEATALIVAAVDTLQRGQAELVGRIDSGALTVPVLPGIAPPNRRSRSKRVERVRVEAEPMNGRSLLKVPTPNREVKPDTTKPVKKSWFERIFSSDTAPDSTEVARRWE